MLNLAPILKRIDENDENEHLMLGAMDNPNVQEYADIRALVEEVERLRAGIQLHEEMREAELAGVTTADITLWALVETPETSAEAGQ